MAAGHFEMPEEALNMPADAWGPLGVLDAAGPPLLPYQPYSKNDRLGRVCDWNRPQKFQEFVYGRSVQGDAAQTFAFTHKDEEEDESFHAVGPAASKIAAAQKKRMVASSSRSFSRSGRGGFRSGRSGFSSWSGRSSKARPMRHTFNSRNWGDSSSRVQTESTITLMPNWEKLQTLAFTALGKALYGVAATSGSAPVGLRERDLPPLPRPTDLDLCGQLRAISAARYQKATCRMPVPVSKSKKLSFNVSASDDPVLARLAAEQKEAAAAAAAEEEEEPRKVTVYATDNVLAALMTAQRSVLPWAVAAQRKGDCIFLDTRPGSTIDLLSVNETSGSEELMPQMQDGEGAKSAGNLWREATYVADMYAQHVLDSSRPEPVMRMEHECPFLTDEDKAENKEAAPVAYRYRRFALSDRVDLVVRCELQALNTPAATLDGNVVAVCTLNEWNPRATNWRRELDLHRGVVLATELKNNACRMARVTAKAVLAGASSIHIGFVTRAAPADSENHVLLTTMTYRTADLAAQLNISERSLWGVADTLLRQLVDLPAGKYLLTKQDATPNIVLYETPDEPDTADQ